MSKLSTSLVVGLSLVAFAGCKKKKEEGTVQKPTEGVTKPEGSAAKPEAEKPMSGADLAKKYQTCVQLINDAKFDDFKKDCMAETYTVHQYGQDMNGADAVAGWFAAMKKAMPDWKLTPQIIMVDGRSILAVELSTGTQTGELAMPGMPPIPATGKKTGMLFFHKLAINDQNKGTEEWGFDDPATMMGQLGLAPKDAPPTRPAMDKGLDGAPIVVVTSDDPKEKANTDAMKKGYEAFNAHKMPDLLATMTDDTVDSDQAAAADSKGKADTGKFLGMWLSAFSDGKANVPEYHAAGDYVISIGKFEGTHDHDFGKIKKTGKKVSLDFAEVALVKDGKLASAWRFHSGMQFAMQLGLMPAPGAGAPPAAGSAAAPAAGSAAAPADKKPADKKPATK